MHRRLLRTAPVLAAALAAAALAAAPAEAAPLAVPHGQSDVNCDGYGDLVTGSEATVSGASQAGALVVNTGSATGISATRKQIVTQNTAGIPGAAEETDRFGSVLATADLDGDGCTDVIAGTPREDVEGGTDGGTVTVLWGSKSGITAGTTIADPASAPEHRFGEHLAVGDFDGDGRPELAVSTAGDDVWIFGGVSASGAEGRRMLDTAVAPDNNSPYYRSLAAGDFDGDGKDDLAVGGRYDEDGSFDGATLVHPGAGAAYTVLPDEAHLAATGDLNGDGRDELVLASPDNNRITTFTGTPEGLGTSTRRHFDQDTPGVPGVSEPSDYFGESLAVGDVNKDGYADVAVGAEFETVGDVPNAGSVVVLRGSAGGLTGTGSQALHQDTAGVPGANEAYDRFGADLRLTDTDRDGYADLVVGAPMENTSNGAIWVLRGGSGGVGTTRAVSFSAATVGLSKSPYTYFGRGMPTGAYGS